MHNTNNSKTKRQIRAALGIVTLLCTLLPAIAAADRYDYQERGDRREGIRPKPVSGNDIELVSVRADPPPAPTGRPEAMTLAFFLPADLPVHITVRERDYRFYYWLDRVRPGSPWRPGVVNRYRWQTRTVLDWLLDRGLKPADLGVVVRLGDGRPSADERVAPALLVPVGAELGTSSGSAVQHWRFSFKTNLPANLACELRALQAPADPPL